MRPKMSCNAIISLFAFAFFSSACFTSVDGANFLMIGFTDGSHLLQLDALAAKLMDRGHSVYHLIQNGFGLPSGADNRSVVVKFGKDKSASEMAFLKSHNEVVDQVPDFQGIIDSICIDMMTDSDIWERLQKLKIDMAVVDNFFMSCFFLVPHKLGIPFVTISSGFSAWHSRMPLIPSVTNYMAELDEFSVKLCLSPENLPGIIRRACNLLTHVMNDLVYSIFETDLNAYVDYPSMEAIRSNASLILLNNSPLLGATFPKTLRTVFVGGLTTKAASPLNDALKSWLDDSENVVVVSFGSRFTRLPNNGNDRLLRAFALLPDFRFLVRFKTADYRNVQVPQNVKIVDWLPQNDVLGHKNTRLMIAHCGLNGMFEALYHGVPSICLYFSGDQPANGRKITRLGFGFASKAARVDLDWLVDKIALVGSNRTDNRFRANVRRASELFHIDKHPADRAADAVEKLLAFGDEHLRAGEAEALAMSWWEFYMIDVIGAVYTAVLLVVYIVYKAGRFVIGRLLKLLY